MQSGFTLIEVLAALVIVSLGMLAVIEAVSQTASNTTRMRDGTIAHWVAMNQLTEVRLQPRAPEIAKTSDEVEMAGRRWRWTMEVTETPVETMRRIDIQVAEADSEEGRSLATLSGFYGSAIAPAGMVNVAWNGEPPRGRPGSPDEDPPQDSDTEDPPPQDQPPPEGEPVDPPLPETGE